MGNSLLILLPDPPLPHYFSANPADQTRIGICILLHDPDSQHSSGKLMLDPSYMYYIRIYSITFLELFTKTTSGSTKIQLRNQ
jgi:hypothetical protein